MIGARCDLVDGSPARKFRRGPLLGWAIGELSRSTTASRSGCRPGSGRLGIYAPNRGTHVTSPRSHNAPCQPHLHVARAGDRFVGFVNVLWDGLVHAFIEDLMVDAEYRRSGVGVTRWSHQPDVTTARDQLDG